jgi:hypothetical protein
MAAADAPNTSDPTAAVNAADSAVETVSDAELAVMIDTIRKAGEEAEIRWGKYAANGGLLVAGSGLVLRLSRISEMLANGMIRWGLRISVLGIIVDLFWPDNITPSDEFAVLLRSQGGLREVFRYSDRQILEQARHDRAFRATLVEIYRVLMLVKPQAGPCVEPQCKLQNPLAVK